MEYMFTVHRSLTGGLVLSIQFFIHDLQHHSGT